MEHERDENFNTQASRENFGPGLSGRRREVRALERKRHLFRAVCDLILLIAEVILFYAVWMHCYNPYFRNPYVFKGNVFAACVYAALTVIIARFYGQQRLGYHRTFNMIFGLGISVILTNIAAYIFIVLQAATWYLSPVPAVIYLNILDIILIIIWCTVFNSLFRACFPPNRMILVSERGDEDIISKFSGRKDRYDIVKAVHPEEEMAAGKTLDMLIGELADYDAVVLGDLRAELRNDILKGCYAQEIRTYTLPKITDVILKNGEVMELFDTPVFLNRNMGLTPEQELIKRCSDIAMSLIGLIIASPFMLVIAAAIKAEDGGPVFYRQKRCTKDGRVFEILKFRSMIVDAEREGISIPATEGDKRITRIGRIIRVARLDELPQLINILKGDMSVVGPRPERVEHVREYTAAIPEFKYRLSVKGGLTGYAQVYGKYNTSAFDKLKMDLIYIQQYSPVLDLEIILRTVQVLFTRESAEGFDEEKSAEITRASAAESGTRPESSCEKAEDFVPAGGPADPSPAADTEEP